MAPKRKAKVVKTTKKVVQETVEVTLVEKDQKLTAEAENGVETLQRQSESEVVKTTVTVEDKLAEEAEQATVKIPVQQPPQKETATEAPRTPRQPEAKDKTQRQKTAQEAKKDRREQEDVEAKNQPKRAREADEKARGGRRRRRRRVGEGGGEEQYKRYVFRVLKQVHPGLRISSAAMEVLNGYMNDMFERLAAEAARLSSYAGIKTLSSRDIQGAVRLVLPGELGRHAIAEGAKAVTNYMEHDGGGGGGAKSKP